MSRFDATDVRLLQTRSLCCSAIVSALGRIRFSHLPQLWTTFASAHVGISLAFTQQPLEYCRLQHRMTTKRSDGTVSTHLEKLETRIHGYCNHGGRVSLWLGWRIL